MWTRSALATASPGVAATVAPEGSSARAFASVRFQTVTASPRRSMPSTIPLPSSPVPRNATFAIVDLQVESTAVRFKVAHAFRRAIAIAAVLTAVRAVAAQPRVLRWAGDPEGGAPYVEADPSHPDRVV